MVPMDSHNRQTAQGGPADSEGHYRYAVELNPQLPWTADAEGMVLEVGPRWTTVTGTAPEEALGRGWRRGVHPDDILDVERRWACALASGEVFDVEYRLCHVNGSHRWYRARAAPWLDAEGRLVRWYGTVEDIHDRRIAEAALRESEEFARSILEHTPECIKVLDLQGRLVFQSNPGLRLMEIDDFETYRGKTWDTYWPADQRDAVWAAIKQARGGQTVRFIGFCPTMTGTPKWWDNLLAPLPDAEGRPNRILAISRDVSETIRARQEAEATAARLLAVLESTTDSVVVLDREWRITYTNQHAANILSARGASLGGRLWDLFPEEPGGIFDRHIRRAMAEQVRVRFEEYLLPLNLWLEVHVFPTPDGLSIFFRDVTGRRRAEGERRRAQMQIAHMARHDALTGLPNRILFHERLERALAEVSLGAEVAVLCLDLDSFKTVNDTLGHLAGDSVLRQVAIRLHDCLRGGETVARIGGDEFAIVQTGVKRSEEAGQLAGRLIAAIGQPYELAGQHIGLSTCVGIAIADGSMGGDDILKRADFALFCAKENRRGSFGFFEAGMDESLRARQALKLKLTGALARGEFEVHYQPVVDLRDGRVVSLEALLRWRHPERGFVSPVEFVPVAEETGLILTLGEWVLHEACREVAQWPQDIGVAVNLSSLQFRDRDLVNIVAAALAESGLAASRLELEVTESVLLEDNDTNLATLHALRKLGLRIAMDDFGTGYSSLSYLRNFPFDKIKIDRSFVSDLPDGKESCAIVRTVVSLGTSLGIVTTAEGVSTQPQLDWLRAEGCHQGQGYLFSRPVPGSDVPALITRFRGVGKGASAAG
jgi:diguanylate cyclase (GGDEF)-like protein/PAS domain S-box-containing protein